MYIFKTTIAHNQHMGAFICLLDDCLYRFRSPVAGRAPYHWHYDDPP